MWILGLSFGALLLIYSTHFIISWMILKDNKVLPAGSMGLPFIGDTLQMVIPSYSPDLHPFIKEKIDRYDPIFRTMVWGRPVVMSIDPDFNNYIAQQEATLVEMWIGTLSEYIPEVNCEA